MVKLVKIQYTILCPYVYDIQFSFGCGHDGEIRETMTAHSVPLMIG